MLLATVQLGIEAKPLQDEAGDGTGSKKAKGKELSAKQRAALERPWPRAKSEVQCDAPWHG